METMPLRLPSGADLRRSLEAAAREQGGGSAFVIAGIGSLTEAVVRFAGVSSETRIAGPLEILSVSGSLTVDGAHLHIAVSDAAGRVIGGHAGYGNIVRTTAELLLAPLPGWHLTRELDPATGHRELAVRRTPSV